MTPDGEPDESFHFGNREQDDPGRTMPPDGTIRFPIELGLNGSRETLCVVEWEDDLGEHGSPPTTVRTV